MSRTAVYNIGALNLKVQPLLHKEGDLIRSVNVETFPFGAKRKRPGYGTYVAGALPNGSQVQALFNWTRNNGTQFWNYAYGGGKLYHSVQGTGAWTISGNGTFSNAGTMTHAVLEDTLNISDGVGTVHFSTTGTSFVNAGTNLYNGTSTTPAPVAVALEEYHQRIYAAGTASNLFWSNVGTPTDWTNDSSSVLIPGEGKLSTLFKSSDRLVATKNSGKMFRWDEFDLIDLSTTLGPTSSRSIGNIEDYRIYLNRQGIFGYGGNKPELISNPIDRQIYNDKGNGIAGTTFDNAPGVSHLYRYYCTIGTVTDDLTDETVSNAIVAYDFQNNDWWNYSFANRPTSWLSFKDLNGNQQLIFGDSSGQCYQLDGTATSDNGAPISSVIEGVLTGTRPDEDKEWGFLTASFNPGAQAKIQVGMTDTFTKQRIRWVDLRSPNKDGIVEFRFPRGSRSKILLWKVYDSSTTARFIFYGFTVDYGIVKDHERL